MKKGFYNIQVESTKGIGLMVLEKEVEHWVSYLDAEKDCSMFIDCFTYVLNNRESLGFIKPIEGVEEVTPW